MEKHPFKKETQMDFNQPNNKSYTAVDHSQNKILPNYLLEEHLLPLLYCSFLFYFFFPFFGFLLRYPFLKIIRTTSLKNVTSFCEQQTEVVLQ